jgi:hypothetical protein
MSCVCRVQEEQAKSTGKKTVPLKPHAKAATHVESSKVPVPVASSGLQVQVVRAYCIAGWAVHMPVLPPLPTETLF